MAGSGSFAVSRSHGGDRFYNPPAMRRHQQMLLQQQQQQQQPQKQQQQQQQQLQRAANKAEAPAAEAAGNRTDSDDSTTTLSKTPSGCSAASPPRPPPVNVTNLDSLIESVTPFVPALHFSEVNVRGRRTREAESNPYYCLGDLWEAFSEWSVYGVGIPLLLNGKDSIIQYYVPFLSGIQLYVDPSKPSSRLRLTWIGYSVIPCLVNGGCTFLKAPAISQVSELISSATHLGAAIPFSETKPFGFKANFA